jgi:exosortase/archaeosortase family protein
MASVLSAPSTPPISLWWRATAAGLIASGAGALILQMMPQLRIDLFAAGAARLAALLMGAGLDRGEAAWTIALGDRTVAVTTACSGTDFFLMVAALIAWRLTRANRSWVIAGMAGLLFALPVTLLVNALRVVAVAQAHRWLIPMLPERHGAFAHMITGAAIFLPSLVTLNLILELHAKRHRSAAR